MEYKDIASVAGKPGLYKIVKPTRVSVIVETLDDEKKKLVIPANQRISVLDEISIYTTNSEGSTPLRSVFHAIHREFEGDTGIDKDSSPAEHESFLSVVLPDYDRQRVYTSDIKKMVRWYNILVKEAPHLLAPETAGDTEQE